MTAEELQHGLSAFPGVTALNPMQRRVWEASARRLVVISPTGTGKTIAFAGAMLRRMKPPGQGAQAVVLAPSRELVIQIAEVVRRLGRGFKVASFYGRHAMTDEVNTLRGIPDIIVATPGRLLDHLQRGTLHDLCLRVLVIDEYDKALELGFHEEMRRIVRRVGQPDSVILTSATPLADMPGFLDMKGAETIASEDGAPAPRLHVARVESRSRDKIDTLVALLRSLGGGKAIVFVNHRDAAERVHSALSKVGVPASLYHGGLEQQQRDEAVICLDNGTAPVMVATDLAARGLDIDRVEAVVHYHMPVSAEAWTHRNGRTARVNAGGDVYVITSEADDVPGYVAWEHDYVPDPNSSGPDWPDAVTLYFNAGRREKVSRGDIVGYLTKQAGLPGDQIGKIDLRDHCAYAAVPRCRLDAVEAVRNVRLKNLRVRITPLK